MITTIENEWITLVEKRNEVHVQRKFAGLDTRMNSNNTVKYCHVYYFERELYPNGTLNPNGTRNPDGMVIKEEEKWYALEDLAYTEIVVEGVVYSMEALAVLSGFIQSVGSLYIINPSRDTLINTEILPLTVKNGYPLRRDTRVKTINLPK